MNSDSKENTGDGNSDQSVNNGPRVPKKARHPFRRKVKGGVEPKPAEALEKVKEVFDATRARAGASADKGMLSLANFQDALESQIPLKRGLEILEAQLGATKQTFDLNANVMVTSDDGATRQKALELYFAYLLGKPVERKIIENHNVDSMDDLKAKLATNPALCESLAKMIEDAKAGQK